MMRILKSHSQDSLKTNNFAYTTQLFFAVLFDRRYVTPPVHLFKFTNDVGSLIHIAEHIQFRTRRM